MKRMRQKTIEIKERNTSEMKILCDPKKIKVDQIDIHICGTGNH